MGGAHKSRPAQFEAIAGMLVETSLCPMAQFLNQAWEVFMPFIACLVKESLDTP